MRGGAASHATGRAFVTLWELGREAPPLSYSARPAGACRPTGISERTAVTSMTNQRPEVTGGVGTHGETLMPRQNHSKRPH